MADAPIVLGFAEFVELPDWGISGLRGKLDTGARTSALHVENIRELAHGRVGFDVRLHRRHVDRTVHVETKILRKGRVRASSGAAETRVFVATTLRIGALEHRIELSLVDRDRMIYRMLVGRTALGPGVLVDPAHRYVVTRRLRRPVRRRAAG